MKWYMREDFNPEIFPEAPWVKPHNWNHLFFKKMEEINCFDSKKECVAFCNQVRALRNLPLLREV